MISVNVYVLRVFVNKEKKFGNPVGIIVDEEKIMGRQDRQVIAARLGFSESVFINDLKSGKVIIFNPKKEVNFAGHALVGAAYFIGKIIGRPISLLDCKAGQVQTWQEDSQTWISTDLKNTPPWHHEQFLDPTLIDALSGNQTSSRQHTIVWAWIDQDKGIVRARTFAHDWGIPEDEANGSGSMQLAVQLGQKLEIHHGKGSVIYANPGKPGFASVGGRVEEDAPQEMSV